MEYILKIKRVRCQDIEHFIDVITEVDWEYSYGDFVLSGTLYLPLPNETFISIEEVKEDTLLDWVASLINFEEKHPFIQEVINANITTPVVTIIEY